ncbi:MAG TPA: RNA polymerase sigma-70 factor [Gemmatimonadaceae bacterium]|nr:RNA polymerase sigma-70 factor [Gemmatimonadaceae bacterium]
MSDNDQPNRSDPATDVALLARLREGDEAAFDTIFRTWYEQLVALGDRMLRDRAAAEEIVQEVMLELWRRRDRLSTEGSAQAYLFTATRNRVLNYLRHLRVRAKGEPFLLPDEAAPDRADSAAVESEIEAAIRGAITELPPRCREVFELSRIQGLKYSEIAQTLGVSVKAVEAQIGKALKLLRERLAPWLPKGTTL